MTLSAESLFKKLDSEGSTRTSVQDAAHDYLQNTVYGLQSSTPPASDQTLRFDPHSITEAVYSILTSRKFTYVGRRRSEPYRRSIGTCLAQDIRLKRPLQFFLDIGPGYHASLDPQTQGLGFDVGLSELLLISQIHKFVFEVAKVYGPGTQFHLVVDNVCALETNDTPIAKTLEYCRKLQDLIRDLGQGSGIDLLIESGLPPLEVEWHQAPENRFRSPISVTDHHNVERFLGRPCTFEEAGSRIDRYQTALARTEARLKPFIDGIRLTQRATHTTLGFRSFPGGDSRMQCGQVALKSSATDKLKPFLLTSRNHHLYRCTRLKFDDLPGVMKDVILAEEIGPG